jgi:hypothetical protein
MKKYRKANDLCDRMSLRRFRRPNSKGILLENENSELWVQLKVRN